ncbi:MAG: hypothetical protein J5585_01585 [Clostridia bacterium]|nr:hypothetical protein [Clostridia bacterium]
MKKNKLFLVLITSVILCVVLIVSLPSCIVTSKSSDTTEENTDEGSDVTVDIEGYSFDDIDELLSDDYSEGNYQHNHKIEISIELVKVRIKETYNDILKQLDELYVAMSENEYLLHYEREDYDARFVVPFKEYYTKQMSVLAEGETALSALAGLSTMGGTAGTSIGLMKIYTQYRNFYDLLLEIDGMF